METIKLENHLGTSGIENFYLEVENSQESETIVLDFTGVKNLKVEDVKKILSVCLKSKNLGNVIKIKNMSIPIRNQFLLSGLNNAGDEITL